MGYLLACAERGCGQKTWVGNIVNLIDGHTQESGWLRCAECGGRAHIHRESDLQEGGKWPRWIKGIIKIPTGVKTWAPYVFLLSDTESGPVSAVHFGYYKDTRPQGGRLKHGHGPGGGNRSD